ncbi:MAG: thiamine pyrophosphate-dependent dehydrogenase E1 component subunit alpha [Oscillospiraceae bacterium]|nr:thiamine pyrophosphate-dependent dehydrogenase E1 component subunit alpha [Oscillospiraceae bacterium]
MTAETALALYQTMLEIRLFEETLYRLFSTRDMPGSMHQYNGEEAIAAGVCGHLVKTDYITSTHRGHGHCIAKGADMNAVMAEMFAKSTGCCAGMGGSMHIADFGVGMLGANGIVGGGIPHAVGAAWKCAYKGDGGVAVAFFGDGASNEGSFHESLNLAAVWGLPAVFVCENNLYGFSTHYRRVTPVEDIACRAASYGMEGLVADGMDVEDVYAKAGDAIAKARAGGGPTLLECKAYRYMGHSRFENPTYRPKGELESWKARDPIGAMAARLMGGYGLGASEIDGARARAEAKVAEAVAFAEGSPEPGPKDYERYLHA